MYLIAAMKELAIPAMYLSKNEFAKMLNRAKKIYLYPKSMIEHLYFVSL